jgi:hypothetical protein
VSSSTDSDVGDIFAGCFLSLAGSLVGTAIGTVVLALRMLPELRIGELLLGLVAGFLGGIVVGAIATFAVAPLARVFGRGHAENIWIGGVALAAATGAAVTAWLLIPV